MKKKYDTVIVGTGPSGLGAAFQLTEKNAGSILMIDRSRISTGGLRNDCKQNYTYPVGFPTNIWSRDEADHYLALVKNHLNPQLEIHTNIDLYIKRAERLDVTLLEIDQCHVGTDRAVGLIKNLTSTLEERGVEIFLETEALRLDIENKILYIDKEVDSIAFENCVLAPGRSGAEWMQKIMQECGVPYSDNIVDIGVRVEAREENYPIVKDYYDPKFHFPGNVRTFCTNSGAAYVVREKYEHYFSVNGHSFSKDKKPNGLVNFAMLNTINLTDPVVSGQQFAAILGQMAMQLSGGKPMMQRIGDFRLGKRSKRESFNSDLYDFEATLSSATPGDISLAMPAKILRRIWRAMKQLDTIIPGVLHPSTIVYYPEIKTYGNRPEFIDRHFQVREGLYMIGDGAGTSRGITAAWASGIRAAEGILE